MKMLTKLRFIIQFMPLQSSQIRFISASTKRLKRRQDSPLAIAEKLAKGDVDYKKKHLPPVVQIWKFMTVEDLAKSIGKSVDHIFECMIYIPNTNSYDTPQASIDDLKIIREIVKKSGLRSILSNPISSSPHQERSFEHLILHPRPIINSDLVNRDPVITIMGHVDHGKTTLLDSLRSSHIVDGEAGGITQHIGAFRVKLNDRYVTFLDTPGHAAFSALRNRGAQATDMVILVVAADDGVMEQTRESIVMAKGANVPFIVAINKIDKSKADIDRSKSMLLQEGIQLEDFGGDVQSVCISALKGTNLNVLMDVILLQADMMKLQSEINGKVEGVVLESRVDHGRGKLCSGLIQRGTLKKTSYLVAGTAWAKVRGLFDENGNIIQSAGPSVPAEIIGWKNELPFPGEKIYEVDSEKLAKEIVEYRESLKLGQKLEEDAVAIKAKVDEYLVDYKLTLQKRRELKRRRLRRDGPRTKEIQEDLSPRVNVIIKGDVEGSVEAFLDVIDTYDSEQQCKLDIVHYGVGEITENDVKLAEMFNGFIYAYGVGVPAKFKTQIGDRLRESRIIYRLVEHLKKDIESKLPMVDKEEEIGVANVLENFVITDGKKKISVAGGRCVKGNLLKSDLFKLIRGEDVIFDGKVTSMRHLKTEVDSIKNGTECGIALSDTAIEFKPGDTIICYKLIQVSQKSEWDPGF